MKLLADKVAESMEKKLRALQLRSVRAGDVEADHSGDDQGRPGLVRSCCIKRRAHRGWTQPSPFGLPVIVVGEFLRVATSGCPAMPCSMPRSLRPAWPMGSPASSPTVATCAASMTSRCSLCLREFSTADHIDVRE